MLFFASHYIDIPGSLQGAVHALVRAVDYVSTVLGLSCGWRLQLLQAGEHVSIPKDWLENRQC